jgi:hypothetical protein
MRAEPECGDGPGGVPGVMPAGGGDVVWPVIFKMPMVGMRSAAITWVRCRCGPGGFFAVMRVPPGQELGVLALGVQRVGGDDTEWLGMFN